MLERVWTFYLTFAVWDIFILPWQNVRAGLTPWEDCDLLDPNPGMATAGTGPPSTGRFSASE